MASRSWGLCRFRPARDAQLAANLQANTDASGHFTIAGLSSATYLAQIVRNGVVVLSTPVVILGDAAPSLVVPDGATVSGHVTSTVDGSSLADAVIQFIDPMAGTVVARAASDALGVTRSTEFHPEPTSSWPPPRRPRSASLMASGFAPGTTLDVSLVPKSATLQGVVVNSSGGPVTRATVTVYGAWGLRSSAS